MTYKSVSQGKISDFPLLRNFSESNHWYIKAKRYSVPSLRTPVHSTVCFNRERRPTVLKFYTDGVSFVFSASKNKYVLKYVSNINIHEYLNKRIPNCHISYAPKKTKKIVQVKKNFVLLLASAVGNVPLQIIQ